ALVGLQTPLPEVLRLPEPPRDPPRQHEEQVAQPVDVTQRPLRQRLGPREPQDLPARAPAPRPGLMEERSPPAAPRKHERLERLELFLAAVDQLLELRHV